MKWDFTIRNRTTKQKAEEIRCRNDRCKHRAADSAAGAVFLVSFSLGRYGVPLRRSSGFWLAASFLNQT
jgi:hypothetical protein